MSTPTQPPVRLTPHKLAELRKIAEVATQENWEATSAQIRFLKHQKERFSEKWISFWSIIINFPKSENRANDIRFVEMFQPKSVLQLLDALDASEGRQKGREQAIIKAVWEMAQARVVAKYNRTLTSAKPFSLLVEELPCPTPAEIDAELARQGIEVDKE